MERIASSMTVLLYFGVFLLGLLIGYFYALFEFWLDKRGEG